MKIIMRTIACFLFLPLLFSCFFLREDYSKLEIEEVVDDVKDDVYRFNYDNAGNIARGIKRNLRIMDSLIDEIEKAENYEEVFPVIVKKIDALADSYNDIANKKDYISRSLNNRIADIEGRRKATAEKIAILQQEIRETRTLLARAKEPHRKSAYQATLKFKEQELEVWQKFNSGMRFNEIITNLKSAEEGIDTFLDILDANAMVYTQAARTLKAIQSYKQASQDLEEIVELVNLGNDLVDSWSKLSLIIDEAMQHIDEVESIFDTED